MNTIKFEHKQKPLMVAHRGLSGIETENTAAAFVAAGNRSYFGIECDIHKTKDGKYAVIHDRDTLRVSGEELHVADCTLEELRAITLRDKATGTNTRADLLIPSLEEYVTICRTYGKHCVLELKDDFSKEDILEIVSIIEKLDYLESVTFISFRYQNLVFLREDYPTQSAQFLKSQWEDDMIERLTAYHLDLDINHKNLTREIVATCHQNGIIVNTWTVNKPEAAETLADWGVDQITTNILE